MGTLGPSWASVGGRTLISHCDAPDNGEMVEGAEVATARRLRCLTPGLVSVAKPSVRRVKEGAVDDQAWEELERLEKEVGRLESLIADHLAVCPRVALLGRAISEGDVPAPGPDGAGPPDPGR